MSIRLSLIALGLAACCGTASAADLFLSAGKTVYRFDSSGTLIGHADVDTINYMNEGLSVGPDGRLYVDISAPRVDSFALDLSGHVAGFVQHLQGGLVNNALANAFGPDNNLYVAGQDSVDRFYGPLSISPPPGSNDPSPGRAFAHWSSSFTNLIGLGFAPDGTLYGSATDGGGTLYRFDPLTGVATRLALDIGTSVGGLAINGTGTALYVRDFGRVLKYTINGDHSLTRDTLFSVNYPPGGTGGLGSSYLGLTFGPDGALYASTRTVASDLAHTDFVVRIDPLTGAASSYVQGDGNALTGAQNPTFLVFAPVPEPASVVLLAIGGLAALGIWRRAGR